MAYADGCSQTGINNAGLWLFSRAVASDTTIAAMRALLTAQNISQSRLHTVPHDGCKYAGAVLVSAWWWMVVDVIVCGGCGPA